jgi:lysine/ornithine N-monooxygenase
MSRADDLLSSVQKAVGDGPVQLLVGVGDLVSEKLRELPDAVTTWQEENRDFPMRAAGALIGSAFRANLKVGELYDELTRRGQEVMTKMRGDDVFAEEDEPFVHEPFMPDPVRRLGAMSSSTKSTATKKAKPPAKKAATKTAATKKTATKKAATKKAATKKAVTKKAVTKKAEAKVGGKKTASANG